MDKIVKCVGGESRLCDDCWRRIAPGQDGQTWMPIPLYDNGKCEEYWKAPEAKK
jgi:hypothetical protein